MMTMYDAILFVWMHVIYFWVDPGNSIEVSYTMAKKILIFWKDNVRVILGPTKETESTKPTLQGDVNFLSMTQFMTETKENGVMFALIAKDVKDGIEVPAAMKPLMAEYNDVFADDLPVGLSPSRDIQHHIYLVP